MNKVMVALALTLMLVGCEPDPKPAPQAVSFGPGLEATGERIVDIISVDAQSMTSCVANVSSWLRSHPGYRVETITPMVIGGEVRQYQTRYLIVALKEKETQ